MLCFRQTYSQQNVLRFLHVSGVGHLGDLIVGLLIDKTGLSMTIQRIENTETFDNQVIYRDFSV